MILYFSSTGNCRYVAERIAQATNDAAFPICERSEIYLQETETLGFVFPTYFWGLPSLVESYMESVSIETAVPGAYIFFIATYGTTPGQTGTLMAQYLKTKNLELSARYSVKMPDDWTPMFDLSDPEEVAETIRQEEPQIDAVIGHIKNRDTGDYMCSKVPLFTLKVSRLLYERARHTKHLHLEDSCIGCGLCARECPVQAIEMREKKPVWVKEHCVMCLHCLHHCPEFAIQYGDKTRRHGQYHHP